MSNKFKDVEIKKQTNYFFNDIIDIKNFDVDEIKKQILSTTLGIQRL